MEIRFKDVGPEIFKTDLLVVPVFEKKLEEAIIRALDRRLKGKLQERIQKSKFTGSRRRQPPLLDSRSARCAEHLLLIGFGKAADTDAESWRKAGARARREATCDRRRGYRGFFLSRAGRGGRRRSHD